MFEMFIHGHCQTNEHFPPSTVLFVLYAYHDESNEAQEKNEGKKTDPLTCSCFLIIAENVRLSRPLKKSRHLLENSMET